MQASTTWVTEDRFIGVAISGPAASNVEYVD
jgi:hypothetical protein